VQGAVHFVNRNLSFGHGHMNDEIRAVLVRSREDVGMSSDRDRMSVSRVAECQDDSSVSSIKGDDS